MRTATTSRSVATPSSSSRRSVQDLLVDRTVELAEAREKNAELITRLRGVLGSDPTEATRAMTWVTRAQEAEKLLLELTEWIRNNPSIEGLLPWGFPHKLRAQLKTIEILHRDQESLGERPGDDEWWTRYATGDNGVERNLPPGEKP